MLITFGVISLVVGGLAGFTANQPDPGNKSITTRLASLEKQVEGLQEQTNENTEKVDTLLNGKITSLESDVEEIKSNTEWIVERLNVSEGGDQNGTL